MHKDLIFLICILCVDGRVIRERFDFSGRKRVNRFDRDETRRNFDSNRRLVTSTDIRMIRREITETRSRLNDERERQIRELNIRTDLEQSADRTRRGLVLHLL